MSDRLLNPRDRSIQASLEGTSDDHLTAFLSQEAARTVESRGFDASRYELFAVRSNATTGDEVFGPKNIRVGAYDSHQLYGALQSPLPRFRAAVRTLADKAKRVAALDPEECDYAYQSTLFWAEVLQLKPFLGCTPGISSVVTELLTACFQVRQKVTPVCFMEAVAEGLALVVAAQKIDPDLVEQMVDAMEAGGYDTFAPDSLRPSDE